MALKERRVGLNDNPVFVAVLHDIALLTPWVELDLVDRGGGCRKLF